MLEILAIIALGFAAAVATTIGEVAVLTMFYISAPEGPKGRAKRKIIDLGYFIGSGLGILVSAIVALTLKQFISLDHLYWLGVVPIAVGAYYLLRPVADREMCKAGTVMNTARTKLTSLGLYTVMALALSVDDLGVYIPLLSVADPFEIALILIIAVANIAVMIVGSRYISNISSVKCHIDRIQRWAAPTLFILIGIYVLARGMAYI